MLISEVAPLYPSSLSAFLPSLFPFSRPSFPTPKLEGLPLQLRSTLRRLRIPADRLALFGDVQEVGRCVYLKVPNHHETCSVGAACDECCGVNPGMPTLLQELPVEQEAEQGHWGRARVVPALVLSSGPARPRSPLALIPPDTQGQKGIDGQVVNRLQPAGWLCGSQPLAFREQGEKWPLLL